MNRKSFLFLLIAFSVLVSLYASLRVSLDSSPEATKNPNDGLQPIAETAVVDSAEVESTQLSDSELAQENRADQNDAAPDVVEQPEITNPQVTAVKRFVIEARDGRLVAGPARLQVLQGDELQLVITSNVDDELHLHGYDIAMDIKAGVPAVMELTADRAGRFEYELHGSHSTIGALEVQPR